MATRSLTSTSVNLDSVMSVVCVYLKRIRLKEPHALKAPGKLRTISRSVSPMPLPPRQVCVHANCSEMSSDINFVCFFFFPQL